MATQWEPVNDKRAYLMDNGTVGTPPAMERTVSTRPRYRFIGENESYGSRQIEDAIITKLESMTSAKVIVKHFPVEEIREQVASSVGAGTYEALRTARADIARLPQVLGERYSSWQTNLWWRYEHETLPVEMFIVAQVSAHYGAMTQRTVLSGRVLHPIDRDVIGVGNTLGTNWPGPTELDYNKHNYRMINAQISGLGPEKANPGLVLTQLRENSLRVFAAAHAKSLRELNQLTELRVPYYPEGDQGSRVEFLTLKLVETNYTSEYAASLADFLSQSTAVEKVIKAHQELVGALREAGFVLPEQLEGDSLSALLSGRSRGATVMATAEDKSNDEIVPDPDHQVRIDLLTGTVVVDCQNHNHPRFRQQLAEASQLWEVARFQAQVTGEEEELVVFARETVRRSHEERFADILSHKEG